MSTATHHLTEGERQMLADGTIVPDQRAALERHVGACQECAADLERLRALLLQARGAALDAGAVDELWPGIRARIDGRKIVPIAPPPDASRVAPHRRRPLTGWVTTLGGIAAAALVIGLVVRETRQGPSGRAAPGEPASPSVLIAASDSAHAYEAEAQALLNRLELQRALLRPEASRALEHDLRAIDAAIAELKEAIARDPENPALRQLLASSYRQKVELLKRAGNAS